MSEVVTIPSSNTLIRTDRYSESELHHDTDPQLDPGVLADSNNQELQARLVEARNLYDTQVTNEILDFINSLDLDINLARAKEKMLQIPVVLCQLESPTAQAESISFGVCTPDKILVNIDSSPQLAQTIYSGEDLSNLDFSELRTLVHERFHSVSDVEGLKRHAVDLGWLNEAVTEHLALSLMDRLKQKNKMKGTSSISTYRDREVPVFEEMLKSTGIDAKLFYEAYLEEPILTESGEESYPKWEALMVTLEQYSPGFFEYTASLYRDRENIDVRNEYTPEEMQRLQERQEYYDKAFDASQKKQEEDLQLYREYLQEKLLRDRESKLQQEQEVLARRRSRPILKRILGR
ncbi:hypothetical protein KW794_01965 [Candidatus Saccharibacteria bacterium]|nr:hypothetical protein [Candidatus Saccharibacteria bacterium]